jgi:hypothetical protein
VADLQIGSENRRNFRAVTAALQGLGFSPATQRLVAG